MRALLFKPKTPHVRTASVHLFGSPEETSEKIPIRIATADVSLDQDGLLEMPSIVFEYAPAVRIVSKIRSA
jgi:hypothetical protein